MRAPVIACLLLLVALFGACGGRLVRSEGDEGSGGSMSNGASDGDGATSSNGGTGSGARQGMGGTAIIRAGSGSMGGNVAVAGSSPAGGACACPDIDCGPNSRPVPNPDGCCFRCVSACAGVMCPLIACGSGSHLEMLPGQCCPICLQDSCEAQLASYQGFRAQLIDKYSLNGCMSDDDCSIYYEKNQCALGCGIPMPTATLANLESNLQAFAQEACSPKCPLSIAPCVAPKPPICVAGTCR
jgi:hypothetical protein